jgi:glycogen debranching enzyme
VTAGHDNMAATPAVAGPLGDVTCVSGQVFCISGPSGQIHGGGHHGLYIRDTRALSRLRLLINGAEPAPLLGGQTVSTARFTASWGASADLPDPPVFVDRRRAVSESLWEEICLTNFSWSDLVLTVELLVGADLAYIFDVKRCPSQLSARAAVEDGGVRFALPEEQLATSVRPNPPAAEIDESGVLRWLVRLAPRLQWSVAVSVGFVDRHRSVWPTRMSSAADTPALRVARRWSRLRVAATERAFVQLVEQSTKDIASLVVEDDDEPADAYLAAGSPWFLTLFGRDALWGASMSLPLSVGLAGQTLRVLARRQGTEQHAESEVAPGKILHEMRHGGRASHADLTPLYFGSMDATPLFVTLLGEAWRWGLPPEEVENLLPAVERALRWMDSSGDSDGDGFLEYQRLGERGLANQGWKDSHDAIQFADGRLADPPIALCEVQGYAYQAAVVGAELLDAFDRPNAQRWTAWAAALRERFRAAFWVDDDDPYPAVALDGMKRQVDGVASNMGHLPATGLLDDVEIAHVARRLTRDDLNSGWGLRTLSADSPRFNPLSYHGGSVWPHDTAIAVYNLAVTGHGREAAALLNGLVAAAPFFGFRLPELFGGEQREPGGFPIPYPAACRPQAWSAGAALLLLRAALGLHPDVPGGRVLLQPMWPPPYRRLRVRGLRLAGGILSVTVDRDSGVTVDDAPDGLDVKVVTGGSCGRRAGAGAGASAG